MAEDRFQQVATVHGSAFGMDHHGFPIWNLRGGTYEGKQLKWTGGIEGEGAARALTLLTPEERQQVQDPTTTPTIDLAPKIQAWLDQALGLYGNGLSGTGGRGACLYFDAGTWLISHLDLRPGVQIIGLASRYEVQFNQTDDYNGDHFITILGHADNTDVVQRRTEVYISDINFTANGNLDSLGNPLDCMHAQAEVFDDNTDPDDAVTRTGVIGYRFACEGASGYGYYSKKRGKNWLHECQFTRNGTLANPNNSGGIFVQGPDSKFEKCYCGSNYGHQFHPKSCETPMIFDVELGTTKSDPTTYVSLYLELCTSACVVGGNSTGPFLIEGGEGDTSANEYGVDCWVNIADVIFTFKDKTFTNTADSSIKIQPGYIRLKNIKGVVIDNCRYHPAYSDDDGANPMTHTVSHRPTAIIDITGSRTTAAWRGPLPVPTDNMWPAGSPENSPVAPPTDPYGAITNKIHQLSIQAVDPTKDTHANLMDQLRFIGDGIQGFTGGNAVAAGYVGEVISSSVTSTAPVTLTSGVVSSITNIALTAGNWDVRGTVVFQTTGVTASLLEAAISTTTSTVPSQNADRYCAQATSTGATVVTPIGTLRVGPYQVRLSAGESRYLNAKDTTSAGSITAYGAISATRMS